MDDLASGSGVPCFSENLVADLLERHYALSGTLTSLDSYSDQNWLLTSDAGQRFVVKVANANTAFVDVDMQNAAMAHLKKQGIAVPSVILNADGQEITCVKGLGEWVFFMRLLPFLPGSLYADTKPASHGAELWHSLGACLARIDNALEAFHHPGAARFLDWDLAHGYGVCQQKKMALGKSEQALVDYFLDYYFSNILPRTPDLAKTVIHNDANDYNLLIDDLKAPTSITGLIDFGDMVLSHTVNELAIGCAYAMLEQDDPMTVMATIASGYHALRPLTDTELSILFGLIGLRLCTTVCNAAIALQIQADNEYLKVSVRPARALLSRLRRISPFAAECRLRKACGLNVDKGRTKEEIIEVRKKHLGKTLGLTFREPLKIVCGQGAYLYDEAGTDYLDMVNNVCHVGHCHPRVAAAGQMQMAQLNINTRFLHDNLADYAEKLLATLPAQLSVCTFVNSGSEANELAFRLARNFSGSKDILTVDGAYHGNTSACIDASPYKFDGLGGDGKPDHVHKVLLPDPYRGPYLGMEEGTGQAYARDVARRIEVLQKHGRMPGAFICESLQGVAGQIIMPDGYLKAAYANTRAAGGVCIADEVQVGFGRVGTHMWAFETQGVVPDIVTLGKPIGNGHPMAAVITTREIADAFVTGMEYFNTFGGNPVSCAIGMAVLDVINDEGLMDNALETGSYLQARLRELQEEHEVIGDVRGLGLFIGVELVTNPETKEPATELADELVEFMKNECVILSAEGQFDNVLKIKPPIVFNRNDADRFVLALETGLQRFVT